MQFQLAPGHSISRVIKGGWQLAGGHGAIDKDRCIADMIDFCDAGISTFDCADIYTGVEELIGTFRKTYLNLRGHEALDAIKVHTKCVPDLAKLSTLTRTDLARNIDTSLNRLGSERLDLVQFHWWDYEVDRYIEVAGWLTEFREAGKIANIGATNFDTQRMSELVSAGVPLVSMQVQYSLLDDRPARQMAKLAQQTGVHLVCYGSVSGGLLSERWLGAPEPVAPYENRSLHKYKLIVNEFGGWELFQELLSTLSRIAQKHETDIASVASRMVLDRPGVAAVIVGARNRAHLLRNASIPSIVLSTEDKLAIGSVLKKSSPVPGDVYALERDRHGIHGKIMKYNLNRGPA